MQKINIEQNCVENVAVSQFNINSVYVWVPNEKNLIGDEKISP